jgi:pyrimidine operon attenuation protein/uracil phosphoribosyltransferase
MASYRELFPAGKLSLTLQRLGLELLENYPGFENTCLLALQPRGVWLGRRLLAVLRLLSPEIRVVYGELDVTFHRDDFRRMGRPPVPNTTKIDFVIEGMNVIIIDDVLYTGRTVRAAMDAMLSFGRPEKVELLVLVDRRRKRDLPIVAQYVGVGVDTLDAEKVIVRWEELHGQDSVRIETQC